MYVVEKPKYLDILKVIPYDGCTKTDIYHNIVRSKDYVDLGVKYWIGEGVIILERKANDSRYLWLRFTEKGIDVKRVYNILAAILELRTKDFRSEENKSYRPLTKVSGLLSDEAMRKD